MPHPDGLILVGSPSVTTPYTPTLSNVTLAAPLTVPSSVTASASLTLTNGAHISLLPGASAASPTRLYLSPLSGSGEILFDGTATAITESLAGPSSSTLSIPPSFTVRTAASSGSINASFIEGAVSAQTPGQSIALSATAITGTIEAKNGGTLTLSYPATPSFLTGPANARTLATGTWSVADASTLSLPATITTNAAKVTLAGPASSFDALNSLSANTNSLTLTNGRTLTTISNFTNTGTLTLGPSSALKVTGSLINPGTLSLAGGTLLLDYSTTSPIDALRQQLLTHHLTTPLPNTAIAYAEASLLNLPTYAGLPVDPTTLLTKLTLQGDANLDGSLTPEGYAPLDNSLAQPPPNPHWTDGDFNYDGIINDQDYLLIDIAYLPTYPPSPTFLAQRESQFGKTYITTLLASLPEPSLLSSVFCLLPFLPRPRRK